MFLFLCCWTLFFSYILKYSQILHSSCLPRTTLWNKTSWQNPALDEYSPFRTQDYLHAEWVRYIFHYDISRVATKGSTGSVIANTSNNTTAPQFNTTVDLTFLSVNSKGLNHPVKKSLWKEAMSNKCDVLCAQETHFCILSPPSCTHKMFLLMFLLPTQNPKWKVYLLQSEIL